MQRFIVAYFGDIVWGRYFCGQTMLMMGNMISKEKFVVQF